MSDKTEYKMKLSEIEEIPAQDDLVQGDAETGGIYIDGAGVYKRGEVLMSDSNHHFVKATESGMSSADELCILSEDIEIDDESMAMTTGYFFGTYNQNRIILPEGMSMDVSTWALLRKHGIYIR